MPKLGPRGSKGVALPILGPGARRGLVGQQHASAALPLEGDRLSNLAGNWVGLGAGKIRPYHVAIFEASSLLNCPVRSK